MNEYPMLFKPMNIGKVTIPNRIVMTAMGVDVSAPDGSVTDRTIAYYNARAKGGVGLIVTEYCRVNEADGACATGQISLSHDRYIPGMKKLTDSVHAHGSKIFVQLQHPGRQSIPVFPTFWPVLEQLQKVWPGVWNKAFDTFSSVSTDTGSADPEVLKKQQRFLKPVLAPSVLPPEEDTGALAVVKTRAFTTREIKRLVRQFINAAERAQKAGFDGVELHAAHGYLFEQFLSPWTNRRTDAYGGSRENRCRVLKEIISGIHARCGKSFPVTVRLTVDEFYEKLGHPERGIHLPEGVEIAKLLESYGVAALNVSIAGQDTTFLVTESLRYEPGWRNYLTRAGKEAVSIPVIGVSVTRTPEQAERQLQNGDQDFIGLGRPLLADPDWARKAREGKASSITRCIGCLYCMDRFAEDMLNDKPIECAVNPLACHELNYYPSFIQNGNDRSVIIVGAGVSGLYAAKVLALRGFAVTVYEKNDRPGGQVNLADKPPCKQRIHWSIEDLEYQATEAGAVIHYNCEVTADQLRTENPYAILLATGATESLPKIEGADQDFVTTVAPVLTGAVQPHGQRVAVIGAGMTGLETAELLMENENEVTVIGRADVIAKGATGINVQEIKKVLTDGGVRFLTGTKLEKIVDHSLYLCSRSGAHSLVMADLVVLALGGKANNSLYMELKDRPQVYEIGNAATPGRIAESIRSAFDRAVSL